MKWRVRRDDQFFVVSYGMVKFEFDVFFVVSSGMVKFEFMMFWIHAF